MATLLMVESWVHSSGRALPPLLTRLGHDFVLLTRNPQTYRTPTGDAPTLRDAAEVVVGETNDLDALLPAAVEVAGRRRIDGVLTTCDYYLGAAAAVARQLGLPGEDPAVLRDATRKDRVRAALAAAGVPDVAHGVAGTWDDVRKLASDLGYPLVAKPVDLNSGTGVRRVVDEDELAAAFASATGGPRNSRGQRRVGVLLLEQVLVGQEVSVETVTWQGETTVLAVTDKSLTAAPAFVESGHMVPARLDDRVTAATGSLVRDALRAVGIRHGLAHTEVMLTAEGPRIVEINPRQGGNSIFELVRRVTGTHPLEVLVDLALGRAPELGTVRAPRPGAATVGSASIVFVMSPETADVTAVEGTEALAADPEIVDWDVRVPVSAARPVDNSAYLGHVMTVDAAGDARRRAERAVASLRLRTADGRLLTPLGVPSGLAGPVPDRS
ncbi:MAG: acetyl-CoA carboxylase biotin carboxylase subunit family protein [Actinomycetales bacterium]